MDAQVGRVLNALEELGLVDTTIVRLQQYEPGKLHLFHEFYEDLAGIYRYKYGEVQLEFLWDGTPHHIKYQKEWEETFKTWIADFSVHQTFTRAIFELTVFRTDLTRPELAQSRLKTFLVNHFDLKLYQYKGLLNFQEDIYTSE